MLQASVKQLEVQVAELRAALSASESKAASSVGRLEESDKKLGEMK